MFPREKHPNLKGDAANFSSCSLFYNFIYFQKLNNISLLLYQYHVSN